MKCYWRTCKKIAINSETHHDLEGEDPILIRYQFHTFPVIYKLNGHSIQIFDLRTFVYDKFKLLGLDKLN